MDQHTTDEHSTPCVATSSIDSHNHDVMRLLAHRHQTTHDDAHHSTDHHPLAHHNLVHSTLSLHALAYHTIPSHHIAHRPHLHSSRAHHHDHRTTYYPHHPPQPLALPLLLPLPCNTPRHTSPTHNTPAPIMPCPTPNQTTYFLFHYETPLCYHVFTCTAGLPPQRKRPLRFNPAGAFNSRRCTLNPPFRMAHARPPGASSPAATSPAPPPIPPADQSPEGRASP